MVTTHEPVTAGGPLEDARTLVREATTNLGYADRLYDILATPRRVQANQAYWWSADEVEAPRRRADAQRLGTGLAPRRPLHLPLRTAATCLAVERVAQAHQIRGLYP
jgi:glutamate dehydrogenase/leucine dehydrogenase